MSFNFSRFWFRQRFYINILEALNQHFGIFSVQIIHSVISLWRKKIYNFKKYFWFGDCVEDEREREREIEREREREREELVRASQRRFSVSSRRLYPPRPIRKASLSRMVFCPKGFHDVGAGLLFFISSNTFFIWHTVSVSWHTTIQYLRV